MPTPINNDQPSLGLTEFVPLSGLFPSRDGGIVDPGGIPLGAIRTFAGDFVPHGSDQAEGQLLVLSQNTALFSLLGTSFGGNGQSNFALPDLGGRTMIGTGQGPGLSPFVVGQQDGTDSVTLAKANLPVSKGGSGLPFDNREPSLAVTYLINAGGGSSGVDLLGEIVPFAGNFVPTGYLQAAGQLVSIASAPDLFLLLGTTYGGDGETTFGLPDLRGRTIIGASAQNPVGSLVGMELASVGAVNLPSSAGGSAAAIDNRAPSLAMNYIIAVQGIFPSRDSGGVAYDQAFLGEVVAYAGLTPPQGWAFCNGALLPIAQNQALFSLLGTTYGGDGRTTFALPDLRNRTIVGTGPNTTIGVPYGADGIVLTDANVPIRKTLPNIVLNNTSTGDTRDWLMAGGVVGSNLVLGAPPASWKIIATGDFNGDGIGDLIYENTSTGELRDWILSNAGLSSNLVLGNVPSGWTLAGVGDFNGDGTSDVLWRNTTTSDLRIWTMQGGVKVANVVLANPPSNWSVAAIGDFNGDGTSDIVWRDASSGDVRDWGIVSSALATNVDFGAAPLSFGIAATGDFNGDGTTDILWQDSVSGDVRDWLMHNHGVSGNIDIGATSYRALAEGNFNNDGTDDLLWRNASTGDLREWNMSGGVVGSQNLLGTLPTTWVGVVNPATHSGDPNPSSGNIALPFSETRGTHTVIVQGGFLPGPMPGGTGAFFGAAT